MYPFTSGSSFVRNAWYVAAWSSEVTNEPSAREMLGERLVLFRTADGEPVALADRCPHRGFPLSQSRVTGDRIACAYHGFAFDRSGRCRLIPSQSRIPSGFGVRSYPVVERWEWVWVWMGDPAAPDESLLPDHAELGLTGPPWLAAAGADFVVRARYQLFNENLLDLTHLTFIHSETIGTPGILEAPMTIAVQGRTLRVTRDTLDEETTPFYAQRLGIPMGRIDRRHVTTFVAPSFHVIHVITTKARTDAGEAPVVYGEHKILHAITPVNATTLHDYWAIARTYNQSPEITEFLRRSINGVIQQDIVVLEATESLIDDTRPVQDLSCAADEAGLKGRRLVAELLAAEQR